MGSTFMNFTLFFFFFPSTPSNDLKHYRAAKILKVLYLSFNQSDYHQGATAFAGGVCWFFKVGRG